VGASGQGNTEVIGAGVVVVAVLGGCANAASPRTLVLQRARVLVVTGHGVVGVQAPLQGAADIVGARVPIIAIEGVTWQAIPLLAEVVDGAQVAIVARSGIEFMQAPLTRLAGVVGARVTIVAIEWRGPLALPILAGLAIGTLVAVFARETVIVGHTFALAGKRLAL
jgi:hypothetical protein